MTISITIEETELNAIMQEAVSKLVNLAEDQEVSDVTFKDGRGANPSSATITITRKNEVNRSVRAEKEDVREEVEPAKPTVNAFKKSQPVIQPRQEEQVQEELVEDETEQTDEPVEEAQAPVQQPVKTANSLFKKVAPQG